MTRRAWILALGALIMLMAAAAHADTGNHEVLEVRSWTTESLTYPRINMNKVREVVPGSTALAGGKARIFLGFEFANGVHVGKQNVTYVAVPKKGLAGSIKKLERIFPKGYSVKSVGSSVPLSATLRFRGGKKVYGKVAIPLSRFKLGQDYALKGSTNHTRLVKAHGSRETRAYVGTTGFKRASLHANGNTMQMEPRAKLRPSLTGRIASAARRTAGWFRPRAARRPTPKK